jgi:hypothetical protein
MSSCEFGISSANISGYTTRDVVSSKALSYLPQIALAIFRMSRRIFRCKSSSNRRAEKTA